MLGFVDDAVRSRSAQTLRVESIAATKAKSAGGSCGFNVHM